MLRESWLVEQSRVRWFGHMERNVNEVGPIDEENDRF